MGKNTYLGIDLGTSSIKLLLVYSDGKILAEASVSYPVMYPKDGWSEQDPLNWVKGLDSAISKLFDEGKYSKKDVKGISFGGQMHGLVALDSSGNVIRPCILWNDGRTGKQVEYLNEKIGKENLSKYTGNIAFAGFTAPKILWMKENEPENFKRISKIMLPKDYLCHVMTGQFSTDYSDASGMLLLDVEHKCWSKEMCEICSVDQKWLPKLYESYEVVGKPLAKYGFENAVVTAGAGDNAAAAIGTGTVYDGSCNVSLGTSGTIFLSSDKFSVDEHNALHSFCHANGKWHLMGCILTAASARKWWLEDIMCSTDYVMDEKDISEVDDSGLIFLPYLTGERSPHNDVNAKGAFIGLRATTTKGQMSRAIMEGVAFAIRDCLEVAKKNGTSPKETNFCGGGAKSHCWRQIMADVLNMPVCMFETEQGPSYGAAILAMVGAGEYTDVKSASMKISKVSEKVYPNPDNVKKYDEKYALYAKSYPLLKEIFQKL